MSGCKRHPAVLGRGNREEPCTFEKSWWGGGGRLLRSWERREGWDILVGMGGNTGEVGGEWGWGVVWVGASRRLRVMMGRWEGCYVFESVGDGTVVDGKGGFG